MKSLAITARRPLRKWYTALFVLFVPTIPHTDTEPRTVGDSVKLRSIMYFGLLLLSCRGEGLR
ncbi:hypothetical protein ASR50_12195 [Streptomyces sp. 4F]|nr:hypothetical protein ASR50_12195 [Streptomyces sp. 4F]